MVLLLFRELALEAIFAYLNKYYAADVDPFH